MAGPHKTVAKAQLAVSGDKGKYPEFKGNVKTVETRGFWRETNVSPRNQGFHYNQNAETYMLVGEALGRGMLELLKVEKYAEHRRALRRSHRLGSRSFA